ncbi:hypothetical protein J7I80_11335 [Bacillus sp. ISL-41]|nr:hypothetical protein [Bacillus sp. ISL-41]
MHISRVFLGVVFLLAGINGYFVIFGLEPFIATSPEAMALFEFKYLLVAEKSLGIFCGILLITHQFIPLALSVLAPIVANILLLHLFVDHSLLPLVSLLVISFTHLLYFYRANFMSLVERKPKPAK